MRKIINPCRYVVGNRNVNAFCLIKYEGGNLSISGVVGHTRNGGCFGSCGQCVDEIASGSPTKEWDKEMLDKFCDIWRKWHLNDMRAYCNHMKELGWLEQFDEEVEVKKWDIKADILKKRREVEEKVIEYLKAGKTFTPTPEEVQMANLKLSVTTYNDEPLEYPGFYEFKEKDCLGYYNLKKEKRRQLSIKETELGFIGKKCPVCGHKYGSSWLKEEVPEDVIDFLKSLPVSKIEPAWI